MRVLVLGACGVIGTRITVAVLEAGHQVTGLGRSTGRASRRMPGVTWISCDLADLQSPAAWRNLLETVQPEAIVNAAGVLQDGGKDDVTLVQETAMIALYAASETQGILRMVQISAARADMQATAAFMRTKGVADYALRESTLDWVILRPGLVIAPDAYGGTALLRALSSVPLIQPMAHGDRMIQTVGVDDVAAAALAAISGRVPTRQTYDLVEDSPHTLREVVGHLRAWHGLPPAREFGVPLVALRLAGGHPGAPPWVGGGGAVRLAGRIADALAWLGWRSRLRTTALTELEAGIRGDPEPWRKTNGRGVASFVQTLQRMPSTVQDRGFGRSYLLLPAVVAVLSAFWIATGLIALMNQAAAMTVLEPSGLAESARRTLVVGGAVFDMVLGIAILFRRFVRMAGVGMLAVSAGYLLAGSALTPGLWLDPLGPLVKVFPVMALALTAIALIDER